MINAEQQILDELRTGLRSPIASAQHAERTADCPGTWEIAGGVAKGWDTKWRKHVAGCDFCKKVSAMQWNIEPPGNAALWRHFATGTLPTEETLRRFVDDDRLAPYMSMFERFEKLRPVALLPAETLAELLRPAGQWAIPVLDRMRENSTELLRAAVQSAGPILFPFLHSAAPMTLAGPGELDSNASWAMKMPLEGTSKKVDVEILPDEAEGTLFRSSPEGEVRVTLRIREEFFPEGVFTFIVRAVLADGTRVDSTNPAARLWRDRECLFEFKIPPTALQAWHSSPGFRLEALEQEA